jgi:hypothetical protein
MSHYHENCISGFLLLRGLVECMGSLQADVSTGSLEASKARLGFMSHVAPEVYGRVNYY